MSWCRGPVPLALSARLRQHRGMELSTRYDFRATEPRIYKMWLERNCFESLYDAEGKIRQPADAAKPPFSIVIPPPNVTGRLHMGHALNNTIQDVLIRYKRMDGYDALWVPGTDHAGISTQTVVRKQLDAQGIDYRKMGREKFVEKVWEWKAKYGDFIIKQLQKMGCSCDWKRARFTMDDGLSHAVRFAFKNLYDRGLIYRGKRMVNWCPVDRTALSDDEVEVAEGGEPGNLWYIRYPLLEPVDELENLIVATTRPETLFGDVAVAVNPEDTRYRNVIGRKVRLPLQGRIIPVIADPYVDVSFGTGCLKITPAHDVNDFEVAERHGLEPVNVMNEDASLNEVVPPEFQRLDRYDARKKAVEALRKQGLLEKTVDHMVPLGRAQRSRAPIEYRLSDQWFVRMEPLAEKALEASGYRRRGDGWEKIEPGGLRFHSERWENIYARWLMGIRDWCISLQIWWGHRIPAWYNRQTDEVLVDTDVPGPVRENPDAWYQDPDVLDTWFSSWLWPLSTLGWPEATPDFRRYYPTSVLSTAKDIIFFWVARMNFAGLELTGKLPYFDVYIHPTILDERGAVMSKSKGNGIDPVAVIEGATTEQLKGPIIEARPHDMKKCLDRVDKAFSNGFEGVGADALRFTLVFSCSEGQEARLSLQKFNEIGRRFITKLWNASRFVLMSLDKLPDAPPRGEAEPAEPAEEDLWIASRAASTVRAVRESLDAYDFGPVGQSLYRFVWNDYCDWFLELAKGRLHSDDPASARQAGRALGRTLADIFRLLHPIVPFITEELWGKLLSAMDEKGLWKEDRPSSDLIIHERYPQFEKGMADEALEDRFGSLQRLVNRVRNIRTNARLTESVRLKVLVKPLEPEFRRSLAATSAVLCRLAHLEAIEVVTERPRGVVTGVDPSFELFVDLGRHVDLSAEIARIDKESAALRKKLDRISNKLTNTEFVSNAPADVVEKEKAKNRELKEMLEKLEGLRDEYASGIADTTA